MSYYLPRAAARPGRCLLIGLFPVGPFPNLLPFWNPAGPNRETFLATGGVFGVSSGFSSDPVRSSALSVGVVIVCICKIGELYWKSIFCKQLSQKSSEKSLFFLRPSLCFMDSRSSFTIFARSLSSDLSLSFRRKIFFESRFSIDKVWGEEWHRVEV